MVAGVLIGVFLLVVLFPSTPEYGNGLLKLVCYEICDESLGFALEDRWNYVQRIDLALDNSTTWKEFRQNLPDGEFESLSLWVTNDSGESVYIEDGNLVIGVEQDLAELAQLGGLDDERIINGNDEFEPLLVPGYGDGDYPPFLNLEVDKILPSEFIAQFGIPLG